MNKIDFMFKTWFIKSPDILYCFVQNAIDSLSFFYCHLLYTSVCLFNDETSI